MSYKEEQRIKAIKLRNILFDDEGGGLHNGRAYDFVLQNPKRNLWHKIRHESIEFFKKYGIEWHKGNNEQNATNPEGHLLSSNIACINHLFYLRQRQDLVTLVLKNIDNRIENAEEIDEGYVTFEIIGKDNYLGEKSHKRGALSTSIDAAMLGRKKDGKNILVLIEWKYTESYSSTNLHKPAHDTIYKPLLEEKNCPLQIQDISNNNFDVLYYEPFYQLMRQTLLGWKMVENNDYNCDEFVHVHVIPDENIELLNNVTSPYLKKYGNTICEAWKGVLKNPDKYIIISPEHLLEPIKHLPEVNNLFGYLSKRYWEKIDFDISSLLTEIPEQWGLRGDLFLWEELQEKTRNKKLLNTEKEMVEYFYKLFHEIIGHEITLEECILVEKYNNKKGMSSGHICPVWWLNEGIPLIIERYNKYKKEFIV